MSGCVFCSVIQGESNAAIVYEDEAICAFLDHRPLFPGHVLVVPKIHLGTLGDLPSDLVSALFSVVQGLSRAVEAALGAEGSFIAVNNRVSQSVPHLHVHIVPRRRGDGLKGFFWPRNKYRDAAHLEEIRQAIGREAVRLLRS